MGTSGSAARCSEHPIALPRPLQHPQNHSKSCTEMPSKERAPLSQNPPGGVPAHQSPLHKGPCTPSPMAGGGPAQRGSHVGNCRTHQMALGHRTWPPTTSKGSQEPARAKLHPQPYEAPASLGARALPTKHTVFLLAKAKGRELTPSRPEVPRPALH